MKKISTLAALFFLSYSLSAQTLERGTNLLGGTIGFSTAKTDNSTGIDVDEKGASLNIGFGRFYRNNRLLGANVFFGSNDKSDKSYDHTQYGANVFLRQYALLAKSFYIFADESLRYARLNYETYQEFGQTTNTQRQNSISATLRPGLAYGINKRFQLEMLFSTLVQLSYSTSRNSTRTNATFSESKTKQFALSTGLGENYLDGLSFGVRYLFR